MGRSAIRKLLTQRHKEHKVKQVIGSIGPITAQGAARPAQRLEIFEIFVSLCDNSFFWLTITRHGIIAFAPDIRTLPWRWGGFETRPYIRLSL